MLVTRFSDVVSPGPMRPINSPANVSLTGTGTANILNVSGERGILKSVALGIKTANVTGSPVVTLRVQIDGTTAMDMLIWNGSLVLSDAMAGWVKHNSTTGGNFSNVASTIEIEFDLPYYSSCLVAIIIGTAAGAGAFSASVIRKVPI